MNVKIYLYQKRLSPSLSSLPLLQGIPSGEQHPVLSTDNAPAREMAEQTHAFEPCFTISGIVSVVRVSIVRGCFR